MESFAIVDSAVDFSLRSFTDTLGSCESFLRPGVIKMCGEGLAVPECYLNFIQTQWTDTKANSQEVIRIVGLPSRA